jgi:hypothetical protein
MDHLENLGMILSNIVCRQNGDRMRKHPLMKVHKEYAKITLKQLANMSESDKKIITGLLTSLEVSRALHPSDPSFSEKCYDALWALADQMYFMAKEMEDQIYRQAFEEGISC